MRATSVLAGLACALTACTGSIEGGSSNQPEPGVGVPPGQPGGGGGVDQTPAGLTLGNGVIHRLTRTEYNNTVRELFGITLTPADRFPPDVGAYGFDNASAAQSLSASHVEAFDQAAEAVVNAWAADPALRSRVVTCDLNLGEACLREALTSFVPKAFRRSVEPSEIDRLLALAGTEMARQGNAEEQLKVALRGVLGSPHFLFRVERDPNPLAPVAHRVNDYELASRLSYFLWSSMPDETLFSVAAQGTLRDDTVLSAEVTRMLADPKAQALIDVFVGQWLQLQDVPSHLPDSELFPTVTTELKLAMEQETKLFVQDLLATGGSMQTLVGADYTFANPALAEHYGLTAPAGSGFSKVSVTGSTRIGGVLGHASILMHTSAADETSPVRRGAWVLTNVLCSPPLPPPADVVTALPPADPEQGITTTRERLEVHRQDVRCASCHAAIDPVGLGLENYDPVGGYRTIESGEPIDATGELPGGLAFSNAQGLAALIAADPRLGGCVAEKLFTFAIGRAPTAEDKPHVAELLASNQDSMQAVLSKLILSEPFRSRRGLSQAEISQ